LIYHLVVTWDAVWDVLKWVLAVLAAGFIGQFGKSLAMRIIERRRNAKRRIAQADEPPPSSPAERPSPPERPSPSERLAEAQLESLAKIEKKRAKAAAKRAKKADDERPRIG